MAQITVKLPDGTALELEQDATGADAAAAIGPGLAKAALAIRVDGELRDLARPVPDGAEIAILTDRDEDALALIRHDTAHVLATAVLDLWPETKVSIGPAIDSGFYYDFEFPDGFRPSADDLPAIEEAMAKHVAADESFERSDVTVAEALERFRAEDQPYKVELIEDLVRDQGVETVSLYRNGPFTDLCLGPHGPSTKRIKAFKLTSVAGAYWRGDESRQMLSRIYGTAFFKKADLEEHERLLEEARARDHRRLGPELGLFRLRPESPGMPFWLPEGAVLLRLIEAEDHGQLRKRGYVEIEDAARHGRRPLAPLRPLRQLPGEHVLLRGRRPRVRPEADELPRRMPRLRFGAALVPRPAAADGGVRARLPARARGRPPRAPPCPGLHPGRRVTSTARWSRSPTRWTRSARPSTSSTSASGSATTRSSSRPGPTSRSEPTRSGTVRPRRFARRSSARGATTG